MDYEAMFRLSEEYILASEKDKIHIFSLQRSS